MATASLAARCLAARWCPDPARQRVGTYEHLAQLFAGQPYGAITRGDWLDNTSLYWLTNTAPSAARLYWQQAVTGQNFYAAADVSLPAAVTVFPHEYVQAPRSWTEQAYHNLIYFHQAERGGHFAAWEQPQLFAEELRRVPPAALKQAPGLNRAAAPQARARSGGSSRGRGHVPGGLRL